MWRLLDEAHHHASCATPAHLHALRAQPRWELASSLAAYSTMYLLIFTSPATGVIPPLSRVRTWGGLLRLGLGFGFGFGL